MKIIQASIVNSGSDDSTILNICVVTDADNLTDPLKVRSNPELLLFVLNNSCFVFVNDHHSDLALMILKESDFMLHLKESNFLCHV